MLNPRQNQCISRGGASPPCVDGECTAGRAWCRGGVSECSEPGQSAPESYEVWTQRNSLDSGGAASTRSGRSSFALERASFEANRKSLELFGKSPHSGAAQVGHVSLPLARPGPLTVPGFPPSPLLHLTLASALLAACYAHPWPLHSLLLAAFTSKPIVSCALLPSQLGLGVVSSAPGGRKLEASWHGGPHLFLLPCLASASPPALVITRPLLSSRQPHRVSRI